MAYEMNPVIVAWEPKWTAPTVEVTCPSCGRRAERSAHNWSNNIHTGLRMTLSCHRSEDRTCYRMFDAVVPVEAVALV